MKISVVLLTYNGGDRLRRIAEILRSQEFAGEVEYVAVDSGSTDGTPEFLVDRGFHVYAVEKKDFSFGPVLDYAFQCATGDVIMTQSQDVVPIDSTYLRVMTEPILKGQADVVQGDAPPQPEDTSVFLWDRMGVGYFTSEGRAFMKKYGNIGLSCTCLAMSREAWKATGFGNGSYSQDKYIQRLLAEKGFRIVGSPGIVAWHGHSYTFASLVRRCLNEGIGWRSAGVRYPLRLCLRDLSIGFAQHLPKWWGAVRRGQARDCASLLFFQIRPVCVWIGNRLMKDAVL